MPCVQTIHTDLWYRPRDLSYDVIKSYHFRPNISEKVGDRRYFAIGSLQESGPGELNGDVIDDVTWPYDLIVVMSQHSNCFFSDSSCPNQTVSQRSHLHSAPKWSIPIFDPGLLTSAVTSQRNNVQRQISQKGSKIRAWSLLMTYNKLHTCMLLRMVTWPMTSEVARGHEITMFKMPHSSKRFFS